MNQILKILVISSFFVSLPALAQKLSVADLEERGEMQHHKGFVPTSLDSLVGSSTIIVKGKFGEVIKNNLFFGYVDGKDDTLEAFMERHKFSRDDAENWAIPMTEYEIIVDEVLLGEVQNEKIVFRKYEGTPLDRALTHPDVERLFFLIENPDTKTYAVAGEASILSIIGGTYSYDAFVEGGIGNPGEHIKQSLDFVSSMKAEEFEKSLTSEISKQSNGL